MSLLREIQNSLVQSDCDLSSLLRKCKILAYRLDSSDFKIWLENEISGYSQETELPNYRIIKVRSKGTFSAPFVQLKNAPIPMSGIPKKFIENLSYEYCYQSISVLESFIKESDGHDLWSYWDQDLVGFFGSKMYKGMNAIGIKKVIPISNIVGIIDEVKNRILNFVLELEKEDPHINNSQDNKSSLSNDTVHQIFNTNIYGTVHNLATGSRDFKQIINSSELFDDLIKAAQKIDDKKVSKEFISHINDMKNTNNKEEFKSFYNRFIASLANHATVFSYFSPFLANLSKFF